MKVQKSIRDLYELQRPLIDALKLDVDRSMNALREPRWHYESRVKTLESFSNKIESGRVPKPRELEDFLACTIVVPNSTSIRDALDLVSARYAIRYQRPPDLAATKKDANAFPFDDLRLYCFRGNDGSLPEEPIDTIVFEVQIKTFLQHAWGVATHDLTYKTDIVRWSKDRIVAHLKATVEYAELTIQEAGRLSESKLLELSHVPTDQVAGMIEMLKRHWSRSDLPENLRGLASSLVPIIAGMNMSIDDLDKLLGEARTNLGGSLPLNLSPYGTVIQTLATLREREFQEMLTSKRNRLKVLTTPELSLPPGFPTARAAGKIVTLQ